MSIRSLKELPKTLLNRRLKYRLRQQDMAYAIGLERQTYRNYERGHNRSWSETADMILESRAFDDDYMKELSKKSTEKRNQLIAQRELESYQPKPKVEFTFAGSDMKEFARKLTKKRKVLGLSDGEAAELAKVPRTTYKNYETGHIKNMTDNGRQIRDLFLLADLGDGAQDMVIRNESQLIRNIPDFYERLNALCDETGTLANTNKNHPDLQELRMMVGGKKVMTSGG